MLQNIFRNMPGVVKNLLIINVLLALVTLLYPEYASYLALRFPSSDEFEPYQVVSHFFMHAAINIDPLHLIFNMFGLVIFGSMLERVWGPKRFLTFYLVCAVGAALTFLGWKYFVLSDMNAILDAFKDNPSGELFSEFVDKYVPLDNIRANNADAAYFIEQTMATGYDNPNDPTFLELSETMMNQFIYGEENSPMVGASGAVYGILIAFAMLFPNTQLMLLFPPIPIKAKYLALILIGIALYSGWNNSPTDNVAHFAHLGGALFGFILVLIWRKDRTKFY